jgi:hypothetical protein
MGFAGNVIGADHAPGRLRRGHIRVTARQRRLPGRPETRSAPSLRGRDAKRNRGANRACRPPEVGAAYGRSEAGPRGSVLLPLSSSAWVSGWGCAKRYCDVPYWDPSPALRSLLPLA